MKPRLIRAEWSDVLVIALQFVVLACCFCCCIVLVEALCTGRGSKSRHVKPHRGSGSRRVVMERSSSQVEVFGGRSQGCRITSRCGGYFIVIHCCKGRLHVSECFSKQTRPSDFGPSQCASKG